MRRALVALAFLLASVVAPAVPPATAAPPSDPAVPTGLKRCTAASEAYCGSVVVPLDRTGATPGTISIAFEYYPRSDATRPSLPTIVAHEGGPGYSTTDSRDLYLDLYRPMMDRRALLLVDERGTGLSGALYCPEAESYDGNWVQNAEACADRLGRTADLYTTAAAVEDMVAVLTKLGIDTIDLYGDSYGSFFAQAFAVRHPEFVRSLVLDGTYPIDGLDPWYRTTAVRLRDNLSLFCSRSRATCPTTPSDMVGLIGRVVMSARAYPVTTSAPDAYGKTVSVRLTPRRILDTLLYTDVTPGYVRELPAAAAAYLAGNPLPLARMVAEVNGPSGDRPGLRARRLVPQYIRSYSEGAYLAYACNDYPQLWDEEASRAQRERQYEAAIAALKPGTFAPWTNAEWANSEFFVYDYCLHWPAPRVAEPPFPAGGRYPNVPTLVMNGDLDLRTDVYQAREVAANFPNATYVEVPNYGHVTSVYEVDRCPSVIVRRFVSTLAAGDTRCTRDISEHRVVPVFPTTVSGAVPATVASSADRSTAKDRRAATVTVEAIADVIDRWYAIPGYTGTSLYGGRFSMYNSTGLPVSSQTWTLKLNRLRWTRDVQVTGTGSMPRGAGTATMTMKIKGAGTDAGSLTITWPTRAPGAVARVTGTIGGRVVDLTVPAPSYY